MEPLQIMLASGLSLELDQGGAADTVRLTVRRAQTAREAKLRVPGAQIFAAYGDATRCDVRAIEQGAPWDVWIDRAVIDLDTPSQALRVQAWLDAFRASIPERQQAERERAESVRA